MNIFRLIADFLHLSAILLLVYRIRKSRNCIGKLPALLKSSSVKSGSRRETNKDLYVEVMPEVDALNVFDRNWQTRWTKDTLITLFWYRFVLQDSRNLLNRILHEIHRPLHVFHFHLQHMHEDIFHLNHGIHYLPYEKAEALLHNVWCYGWRLPPLESTIASCFSFNMHRAIRVECLGTLLVIQSMAWKYCFCAPDRNAEQGQNSWEHNLSLRGSPGHV